MLISPKEREPACFSFEAWSGRRPLSLSSELKFPVPPGSSEAPVWTANGFLIDGRLLPVLSYEDIGPVAWNDELTEVHEEVAGDDHYIERASREHAAGQLRRWLGQSSVSIMDIGCSSGCCAGGSRTTPS